jgi:hypothetical protein
MLDTLLLLCFVVMIDSIAGYSLYLSVLSLLTKFLSFCQIQVSSFWTNAESRSFIYSVLENIGY